MNEKNSSENNGSKLSPEELIRMLKNQLNIDATASDEPVSHEEAHADAAHAPEEEAVSADDIASNEDAAADGDEVTYEEPAEPVAETPVAVPDEEAAADDLTVSDEELKPEVPVADTAPDEKTDADDLPAADENTVSPDDPFDDFFRFLTDDKTKVEEVTIDDSPEHADGNADACVTEPQVDEDEPTIDAAEPIAAADDKVEEVDTFADFAISTPEEPSQYDDREETDYSFDDNRLDGTPLNKSKLPDYNMLLALGVSADEVERIYGADAAEHYRSMIDNDFLEKLPDDIYEYTSASQNNEIKTHYKKEKGLALIKVCAAAILLLLALLFENLPSLGVTYTGWLDQVKYPVVHIMIDLQLVLIAAALALDEIIEGFAAIFRKAVGIYGLFDIVLVLNILLDIVLCFLVPARETTRLVGGSVIFMALLCLVRSYLKITTDGNAFDVVSGTGVKCCALVDTDKDAADRATFAQELSSRGGEENHVVSFKNARFVSGFFGRVNDENITVLDRVLAPVGALVAAIAAAIILIRDKDIATALSVFNCGIAILFPVSVFTSAALAFAKASRCASGMKATIVGENAPFEYAGASVVSFEDCDAFPSYCIKLRNLKVYGKTEVVDILKMTASIFRKIGGPLSDVMECATAEIAKSDDVQIEKIVPTGFTAICDGKKVLVGKAEYLAGFGIVPYADVDDSQYNKSGDVSIMYMAVDGALAAKYYVQYTLNVDFEVLLKDLNRSGVCVAIRTSDPNVDMHLLQTKLNLRRLSVRVVFRSPLSEEEKSVETIASGVVGTGTASDLVHTVVLCDRLVRVLRTNNIVKALSLSVGTVLLLLFALCSIGTNFASALLVAYQLFWMIPTFIISKLFL